MVITLPCAILYKFDSQQRKKNVQLFFFDFFFDFLRFRFASPSRCFGLSSRTENLSPFLQRFWACKCLQ